MVKVTVEFPQDVEERLKELAAREERTLEQQVRYMVRQQLETEDRAQAFIDAARARRQASPEELPPTGADAVETEAEEVDEQ